MLTAIRKDGTPFPLLPRLSKEALRREKEKGEFYCPECREKVVMKIGTKKMEHFAHQKDSRCVESYERESDYHLNGKLHLYQWLRAQNLNPDLEPFYSSIRQRPDIGFSTSEKHYAVEFQCSTISSELMKKRTSQYGTINYHPIWIIGGKNIKRKGENKVSLSHFDYLFVTKNTSGIWCLPAYCPSSQLFILLTNITPITSKKALTQFSILPLQQLSFQQHLHPIRFKSFHSHDWKKEIRAQKLSFHLQGHTDFLKELYACFLNISLLPPMIGLPVQNALVIETAPLIWQTYVFLDHLHGRKAGEIFTFGEVYRCFMNRVHNRQITLRSFPLVQNSSPTAPISEYLRLLVNVQVLEALNANTFRIKRGSKSPEHVIQQRAMEDSFYKQYGDHLFSK